MKRKIPILEAGLSIISIWWAIILFTRDDLFNHVPSPLMFFSDLAPEKGWAIFFLVAAFLKLIGLATDKKTVRLIGLYMSVFLYGLISAGYILSPRPIAPSTGIHFVLVIFALWAIREVKTNVT